MILRVFLPQLKKEFDRVLPSVKDVSKKDRKLDFMSEESDGVGFPYSSAYEALSNSEFVLFKSAFV